MALLLCLFEGNALLIDYKGNLGSFSFIWRHCRLWGACWIVLKGGICGLLVVSLGCIGYWLLDLIRGIPLIKVCCHSSNRVRLIYSKLENRFGIVKLSVTFA
jgi:hypothetical protein